MRVGVLSDTHGALDPLVLALFAGVDHVLHAGDIGDGDVLSELATLAPVTAVTGNIDGHLSGGLGRFARTTLAGLRVLVTHVIDRPRALCADVARELLRAPADLVVFGHSHLPHDELVDGVWFFNPGSAGPRRFDHPRCVGILEEHGGRWRGRHVALDARSETALADGRFLNRLSA
jgi:putative phosphoesterase